MNFLWKCFLILAIPTCLWYGITRFKTPEGKFTLVTIIFVIGMVWFLLKEYGSVDIIQ